MLRPPTRSRRDSLAGQTNNPVNTAKESPSLADVKSASNKCRPARSRALLSTTFSCNPDTHGHNIVLVPDCQRISHLESTSCVVFFAFCFVNELAVFMSTIFCRRVCRVFLRYKVAFTIVLCSLGTVATFSRFRRIFLSPTARQNFFNQRRTRFRVVTGSDMCWMATRKPSDFPLWRHADGGFDVWVAISVNVNKPCLDAAVH